MISTENLQIPIFISQSARLKSTTSNLTWKKQILKSEKSLNYARQLANYWRFTNNSSVHPLPTWTILCKKKKNAMKKQKSDKKGLLDKKFCINVQFGQIRGLMDVPYSKCILNILAYIIQMSAYSTHQHICACVIYRTDY